MDGHHLHDGYQPADKHGKISEYYVEGKRSKRTQ